MKVGILGAGISGLASAWMLKTLGIEVRVFEEQPYVGGLARSFLWHGFTCDFATHRLFSHDASVLQQLLALVPMVRHTRRSRIWLAGKWVSDPVNIVELLGRFPSKIPRVARSYLSRPAGLVEDSFKSYVTARYGTELHDFFFAPYTEKLLGIQSGQISVEWARRKVRIGGVTSFLRESSKRHFGYFYYPVRGGYGAIADRFYRDLSGDVLLESPVHRLEHSDKQVTGVVYRHHGRQKCEQFSHIISTVPLPILGALLGEDYALPYRGASAVYLLVKRPLLTEYHWLYFMDRSIRVNRLVEFKNLSPVGQPPDQTVLCAEVTERTPDLVEEVVKDLAATGLLTRADVLDAMEIRHEFAYPVYDRPHEADRRRVQLQAGRYANLYRLGRSALFEHWELDDAYAGAARLVDQLIAEALPVSPRAEQTVYPREEGAVVKQAEPLVCVVILAFNNIRDTLECLESLKTMAYPNYRIVLVDNGSTDGTSEQVRERYPDVHVIRNSSNLGVPWGYNVGFAWALRVNADYVLMLNNDTTVEPDLLAQLVKAGSEDREAGILMPKVLYHERPTRVWAIGSRYRRFPPAIVLMGRDSPDGDAFSHPRLLDYAPSCGLLIHSRAFKQAGLFDPGYFFFFDDYDFSKRVRDQGLHIRFVPSARMYHKVGRTTSQGRSQLYWRVLGESSVRFYRRHGRPVWLSLSAHVGYLMLREFVVRRQWRGFGQFWAGVREGLTKPLGEVPAWDGSVSDELLVSVAEAASEPDQ